MLTTLNLFSDKIGAEDVRQLSQTLQYNTVTL